MWRKFISALCATAMLTSAIAQAMPLSVFAQEETSSIVEIDNVDIEESVETVEYAAEEDLQQIYSSLDEQTLESMANGEFVFTPDESVLNDPVMTDENRTKLEAYKAKLTAEMEEEGYSSNEDDMSLMSTDIMTFEEYLANYNYKYNCYIFYRDGFELPYRSFVETKRASRTYQSLLVAWRIATFDLSDFAKYSTKEIGFYETILFDVLYQGCDVESLSGMLKDNIDAVQVSALKKIADFYDEYYTDISKTSISELSEDDINTLNYGITTCEELSDVFGAIGNINKVLGYVDNVEELIYKLAKASVIAKTVNEAAKILLQMENYTTNWAMLSAIENMLLVCDESVSEETVIAVFTSEMVVGELAEYMLGEIWKGVLEHLDLYGFAIQAGQAAGKLLSHLLFSTDEVIETYYSLCALYGFEDALKSAMKFYESKYTSSKTYANSKVFNECYKMMLETYLFGAKASQEYVDIEFKHGAVNQLLFNFNEDRYNDYTVLLASLKNSVEQTIEFMDTVAYNGYLDYYADAAAYIGLEKKVDNYTEDEKQDIITLMSVESLETSNIEIDEDYTLDSDIHTYGSLTLKSGTLDLNGYTLTVDGSVFQTGGTMNINSGTLDIGGDYAIAGSVTTNGAGEKVYTSCNAYLNMQYDSDYVSIDGDFAIYSGYRNNLTAGTIEVKGDFSQLGTGSSSSIRGNYSYNFSASGTHTVIFSGTEQQNIHFDSTYSGFHIVKFQNKNISLDSGIRGFTLHDDIDLTLGTNTILIYNTMDLNGHTITEKDTVILDTTTFTGGVLTLNSGAYLINGDLYVTSGTLGIMDTHVTGNLYLQGGTLDLNGHTLTVDGNVLQTGGTMNINSGTLDIGGDYAIAGSVTTNGAGEKVYTSCNAYLNMQYDSDYVSIDGDFAIYSGYRNNLTAGTIEVKGDFSQLGTGSSSSISGNYSYNFSASGTHTVIFSGTEQQNIHFDSTYSGFNNLIIANANAVSFTTTAVVKNELRQIGGASVINPDNVLLDGESAFVDYADLNTEINAYVGNAENVTPTYKDYEAYVIHAEDPEYPYVINSVSIQSTSGAELDSAPMNESFIVNVEVSKQQTRDSRDYLFVAVYDTNGAMLSINYVQAKFVENYTYSFGINIQKQSAVIGYVKAFMWSGFASMQPLAESVVLQND